MLLSGMWNTHLHFSSRYNVARHRISMDTHTSSKEVLTLMVNWQMSHNPSNLHRWKMLKSEQRQQKPWRGTSATDEPEVWFDYEQHMQQLFTLRGTHDTVNHNHQRRTWQLSLEFSSSLPTWDNQGVVPHSPKQNYINDLSDLIKWYIIPTKYTPISAINHYEISTEEYHWAVWGGHHNKTKVYVSL